MDFKFNNVNDAFTGMVQAFKYPTAVGRGDLPIVHTSSRNGDVMSIAEPCTITYLKPQQRVLFNQTRDCNPFFHLFESLWMLAGKNDVASLTEFNSQMSQYSDDGVTFNGAYGYRWRHSNIANDAGIRSRLDTLSGDLKGLCPEATNRAYKDTRNGYWREDQLDLLIEHLKTHPDSRRAVLQMWNVGDDLMKVNNSKDVCCNLSTLFSLRKDKHDHPGEDCHLDMTVFNRSNDLILGALGANAVHFSMLQEYMAARLGVAVGVYHQVSNNLHVYLNNWKPEDWLSAGGVAGTGSKSELVYSMESIHHFPLVVDPTAFDREVVEFVTREDRSLRNWSEPFLQSVAAPMCWAFHLHKRRNYKESLSTMELVQARDWQIAGTNWINKRKSNWENKVDSCQIT